jgi:ribosomal protein L7/L12
MNCPRPVKRFTSSFAEGDETPSCPVPRYRRQYAAAGANGEADGFEEQIAQLLEQGQKIEAIKLYRERTGAGLAEAKRAVERMQVDVIFAESDIEEQLLALVREGRKIEAIRIYRQRTNRGLKDAKDAVEALAAKHGIETRRSGCASMFLLGLVAAGGTLVFVAT